ncbi:MAG: 2-dehydro-3-deoxyglucarate aldolase [Flavobacteriales bacterium]
MTIDLEHNTINQENLRNLIIAGQAKNIPIFVRVPKNDEVFIKKALDAGADGLIIPMINSRQDALDAKDNSYYPPIGKRGVGLSRAQGYRNNFDNYIKWSSENLTIIAQIEHIDAINNLEEIVEVKEIDGLMIGPYDLSASIGIPGNFDNQVVKDALDTFISKSKKNTTSIGQHIVPLEEWRFREAVEKGYNFIVYGTDFQFLKSSIKNLEDLKK